MKVLRMFGTFVALSMFLTATVAGQEAPSDAEKAAMDAWMKAATPAEAHRKLEPFAGDWNVHVKSWMAPGAPVMESKGTATQKWILGGRWLEQRFNGDFMGMPFEGIGYTGYDNLKKSYVGSWMDNMSTGSMTTTGSMDGNKLKFEGSMIDPMTGKDTLVKETITIVNDDEHRMEMWSPGPDGKMFKSMEIVYTRRK